MCGSGEPHPYPVISFTYCNEQVRADEVQRVIVYNSYTPFCGYTRMTDLNAFFHNCYKHGLLLIPLWSPVLKKVVLSKP
jgi:hypothetical protein